MPMIHQTSADTAQMPAHSSRFRLQNGRANAAQMNRTGLATTQKSTQSTIAKAGAKLDTVK